MTITPSLVQAHNEALARIPLTERRAAELPLELEQLAAAADAVRPLLQFDAEPADFVATLHALAWRE